MINQIDERIWFGDKPSPVEAIGKAQSVINAAHSIKAPYWSDLGRLPYDVWYFRLALPDAERASDQHLRMLELVIDGIAQASKFPLLCHCRAGGHRGPMTAMFAYWHLNGRNQQAYRWAHDCVFGLVPGLARHTFRRGYKVSLLEYMEEHST